MKKFLIIIIFLFLQKTTFCQLILGGLSSDTSPYTYHIDTLQISGDSTFYEVKKYDGSVLVHKEQQISIKGENSEIIFHGTTRQWYKDGSEKIKGRFEYGKKKGIWKYWDTKGNLRLDIDKGSISSGRGIEIFYIDGVRVEIREE